MKPARGKAAAVNSPEWRNSVAPVSYPEAVAAMEERARAIRAGKTPELIWLLEHPPLYTVGPTAKPGELIDTKGFSVFRTERGGRVTYHGPGQRVVYVLLDLQKRGKDLHAYVRRLEEWTINVLSDFGVKGERRKGRVGIWVTREDGREEKIAAIGVKIRRWVTYHGLALNVDPDLSHFDGIVPCGLAERKVTSLRALGVKLSMKKIDESFRRHWRAVFGA